MNTHKNHKIEIALSTYKYTLFYCENCNKHFKKYNKQLNKKEKSLLKKNDN
jgi:hypothetical protein